jgi:hypothetical protein
VEDSHRFVRVNYPATLGRSPTARRASFSGIACGRLEMQPCQHPVRAQRVHASVRRQTDRVTRQSDADRPSTGGPAFADAETIGRRLLEIVVYRKRCRIGGKLTLDDLAETAIGDWMMPDFRKACAYAASQGWLIVRDDTLTLTTAGLAAA